MRVICLMGPTASGKTALAVKLIQHLPCEIISVDSAMVYRGLDIGTAKPDPALLQIAPHRLIDLLDPKDIYSAGQFRLDVMREIEDVHARGKIPLLVGGTMLYFRVLQQGLAPLPKADESMRATLKARASEEGWATLHEELMLIDPAAAKKIQPQDAQRIQRALEVYYLTGKTKTAWQAENTHPLAGYQVHNVALMPSDRAALHAGIAERFAQMLKLGFVDEVKGLYERGDLSADLPAIRSVGYRQVWAYLSGLINDDEMQTQVLAATRQLAKRQMTWLRSWPGVSVYTDFERLVRELDNLDGGATHHQGYVSRTYTPTSLSVD